MASGAARVVGMSMTSARHALSSKITTEGRNRINTNARRLPLPRMDGHKFLGGRYFHDLGEAAVVSRCRSGGRPRASAPHGYAVAPSLKRPAAPMGGCPLRLYGECRCKESSACQRQNGNDAGCVPERARPYDDC
jgi:hypothetical protein